MTPFDTFWASYPLRVSRKDAEKALDKALKKTTLGAILVGLESYKRAKPEWQHWAYAASWLNAERWTDEAPMKPEPTFQSSHHLTIPKPDSVSPEERKRVGGRMLALGQALSAATKEARTKMDAERRHRVRERQDMILARDHRSTAERLGFTAGDGGMRDD